MNGSNATSNETIPGGLAIGMLGYSAAIAVVTVLYNLLVVSAFIADASIRKPFNLFILNMALGDTSMAIFGLFETAYGLFSSAWIPFHLCTFSRTAAAATFSGSTYATLLVSVDRLRAVFWPNHYRVNQSTRTASISCAATWLCVVALSIPFVVLDRVPKVPVEGSGCFPLGRISKTFSMIGEVFLFVLPTVGTVLCYGIVVWKVRKRKKHTVSTALTVRMLV